MLRKVIIASLVTLSLPIAAQARGGVRIGIGLGVPVYGGYGYYGPYYRPYPYYYPPPYVAPAAPPVYIERGDPQGAAPAPQQQSQSYWYYCADSKTYYPYVRECPGGWQRVPPQPG